MPLIVIAWLVGLLVLVLVALAGRSTIPRNGFAGLRLPSTMASEDAWRRGHSAALPAAVTTLVVATAIAVIGVVVGAGRGDQPALSFGFVELGVVVAGLLVATVFANRAARRA